MILDHTQDLSGVETHRLTSLYPPPDFVKTAAHEQLCGDPETLPPHCYADAAGRQFPCHSAAATWMSTLFFMDKRAEINDQHAEKIASRLHDMARYFGITRAIGDLVSRFSADQANTMQKLADSDFALVWTDPTGAKERHYPMRNPIEVKAASSWFDKYRCELAWPDRQLIASKLLEKAAEHQVVLDNSEALARTAGFGYCAAVDIADMLEKRARLVSRTHSDIAAELNALAGLVRSKPPQARDQGVRFKLAAVVDQFDHVTKLTRLYDNGLDRPEDVLFQVTEKVAGAFTGQHICLTNGAIYEKTALHTLSVEQLQDWLGEDVANEVSDNGVFVDGEKLASLLETLPLDSADMFERMAATVNVKPFARDKAATARGLSREAMEELATRYDPNAKQLLGV